MEAIPVQQPMLLEVTRKKLILLWNVIQCEQNTSFKLQFSFQL